MSLIFSKGLRLSSEYFMERKVEKYPWALTFNSYMAFNVANLLIFFVHYFAAAIMAAIVNLPVEVFFNRIEYRIYDIGWTRKIVFWIFSIGPIVTLMTGIGLYVAFRAISKSNTLLSLTLYWGFLIAVSIFLGNVIYSTFVYRGFAGVYEWYQIPMYVRAVAAVACFLVIIFTGIFSAEPFLKLARKNRLAKYNRTGLLLRLVFLPCLLGCLTVLGFNLPYLNSILDLITNIILMASMALMAFSITFLNAVTHTKVIPYESPDSTVFRLSPYLTFIFLFIVVIALIFTRNMMFTL